MAGWWCAARGHTWHLLSALRAPVGGGAGCFVRYLGCVNKPLDHNRFHIFRRIRNSWRHVMGWEREREKRRVPIKKWNHFLHFLFHFAHYLRRGSCRSSLSFFFSNRSCSRESVARAALTIGGWQSSFNGPCKGVVISHDAMTWLRHIMIINRTVMNLFSLLLPNESYSAVHYARPDIFASLQQTIWTDRRPAKQSLRGFVMFYKIRDGVVATEQRAQSWGESIKGDVFLYNMWKCCANVLTVKHWGKKRRGPHKLNT